MRSGRRALQASRPVLHIAAAAPLQSPWCRHISEGKCAVSLHFRGQCAWNRGARPPAATPTLLCPDCHWRWLCARSALPWSQPVPTPPHIQLLMTAQSENCVPGAGISSSRISATLRQRLRRHLLRRMSPAWVPLEQFLQLSHSVRSDGAATVKPT